VPLTLETAASEQNPELTVMLDRGRLQLLSGNAIYSWDDLYHNFTIAFGTLDIEERGFQDVLVLGLGLGSVPYILEKIYEQSYEYTAVAALAGKYTLSLLNSPVNIVTADAGIFLEVTEEKFDMIVVDIFEDDHTPDQFETIDFLEICAEHLKPKGIILYNRLYNSPRNVIATQRFFDDKFKTVFPAAGKIDTGGNWILINEA
jgi:spermidine synthase